LLGGPAVLKIGLQLTGIPNESDLVALKLNVCGLAVALWHVGYPGGVFANKPGINREGFLPGLALLVPDVFLGRIMWGKIARSDPCREAAIVADQTLLNNHTTTPRKAKIRRRGVRAKRLGFLWAGCVKRHPIKIQSGQQRAGYCFGNLLAHVSGLTQSVALRNKKVNLFWAKQSPQVFRPAG
jgi:hypothetical protein